MCISSRWFPSFTLPNQNPECILFYPTSATHPTHCITIDLITLIKMGGTKVTCHYRQHVKHVVSMTFAPPCIWQGAQIVKLYIMQFPSTSHYIPSLMCKYLSPHPIPQHPQHKFFTKCEKPGFTHAYK